MQIHSPFTYRQISPWPTLRTFVESIWIQENDAASDRPTTILPTAGADLVVYYGEPFRELSNSSDTLLPRFQLCGQRSSPAHVQAMGRTGIILVRFYPWGAVPFFGGHVAELRDTWLDLEALTDISTSKMVGRILKAADNHTRIELVQQYLVGRLEASRLDHWMIDTIGRMLRTDPLPNIERLAHQLHISRRHLLRRFTESVGLPPKQFINVLRLQRALRLLRQGKHWADIVWQCGFHDQSHFIKECRAKTGLSPSDLFDCSVSTPLQREFNQTPSNMSQFYNTIYL